MPTLNWIGKESVINHHHDVPFRTLEQKYTFGEGTDGNKIIHGDNLEALKALLPEYEGRIKCIYIDPPYNTGNENWVYNDNMNSPKIRKWLGQVVGKEAEDLTRHDKWLCMMYPRLKLLQRLLSDDGAIFISIDDNEQANLKLICDEIFGSNNFIMSVTWRRSDNQANIGRIAKVAEYICIYSKNADECVLGRLPLSDKAKAEYRYSDSKGLFRRGILFHKTRGRKFYPKATKLGTVLNGPWMITEEEFDELDRNDEIYWTTEGDGQPYTKIYLENTKGQIPNNFWGIEFGTNQRAANMLESIFGKRVFDFPKPTSLIESILSIGCPDKSSIILDSFAGSGTTAHAVLNLNKQDGGNRKFILVEMEDYAENITAERVRRVIKGYGEDKNAVEGTGGSFSFYELGEPVFNEDGYMNEKIGREKLCEYIWYTETRTPYATAIQPNKYLLGIHQDTSYYFYYEPEKITTLSHDTLNIISEKAETYVVYADQCVIDKEWLSAHNIIFKKIPRDISRF